MKIRIILSALSILLAVNGWSQGNTGAIKGHVHLTGKLPGNPIIRMGMDPWQEKYGFVTKSIVVKPGAITNVDLIYTGNEKPSSSSLRTIVLHAD